MKRLNARFVRLFAAGLMSASVAALLAASAAANPALRDVVAPIGGVLVLPPVPTVRVQSPRDLLLTLYSNFAGRVIIPRDVQWDLTGFGNIPLRSGVSLIGERGHTQGVPGSRPRLFTNSPSLDNEGYNFFLVEGNDVRVEGIHFQGPANGNRSSSQPQVSGIGIFQNVAENLGFGVVVADNEFNEWTKSAVQVASDRESIGRERAGLARVERNYIHNNAREGCGHGVGVGYGAYVTIEGNVFDFNRHAVEAEGYAGGYIARFNYVLQGGFKQDGYYNQHFDAHGSGDGGYGGKAGEYYEIDHNTIRGEQTYYGGFATRPAFMLRGQPTIGAYFHDNVVVHDDLDAAVSLKAETGVSGFFFNADHDYHFHASGNAFDTDHSMELATGDFDGDGRTDLFVATGTAWFFSRAGIRPWEFLTASGRLTGELGFADIDNDGKTDVLWRLDNGTVYYSKSGTAAPVALTTVPVPMKELRFGDFDGDHKTDIFYTLGGQWYIWYGHTRAWTAAQSSSQPLSELLFGEFDDVPGTDVVGINGDRWAYSSGAVLPWTRLNATLGRSLAGAVAADFDGNGKSDIACSDGQTWYYSRDGRSPLIVLRDGDSRLPYPALKSLLIGRFDGGARAKVVSFNLNVVVSIGTGFQFIPGERLVIWRGLGSDSAFSVHSEQNMR